MYKVFRILVIAQTLGVCAVALSACGQKGPLVHPQDPLSAERASLLQTLMPRLSNEATPKAVNVPVPSSEVPASTIQPAPKP
jgi:predicted small lipoprotein YifL